MATAVFRWCLKFPPRSSITPKQQSTAPGSPVRNISQTILDSTVDLSVPVPAIDAPSLLTRRHVHHVGSTTEIEPYLISLCDVDDTFGDRIYQPDLHRFGTNDTFLIRMEEQSQFGQAGRAQLAAFEVALGPSASALVDLYFETVHPGFPILQKKEFLHLYRTSPSLIAPSLLAAVYLLGMRWWSRDPRLRSMQKPDVSPLRTVALRSLELSMHRPDISTLQAALLLLQEPEGKTWALTSQLIACAQDLGFHLDCSDWNLSDWERGLRKRVGWAVYMQDKWGALVYGRPSHISSANWAVHPLTTEDFEEDSVAGVMNEQAMVDFENSKLLYIQMIALTRILSDVVETFYTLQANCEIDSAEANGTKIVLEKAKPIQIKLKDWYTRLPACLRMDGVAGARAISSIGWSTHNPWPIIWLNRK